jgi:hypothetical protein
VGARVCASKGNINSETCPAFRVSRDDYVRNRRARAFPKAGFAGKPSRIADSRARTRAKEIFGDPPLLAQ